MTTEWAQLSVSTTLTTDFNQPGYYLNIDGARIQDPFSRVAGYYWGMGNQTAYDIASSSAQYGFITEDYVDVPTLVKVYSDADFQNLLQSGQVTLGNMAPPDQGNYYNPAPTPASFYYTTSGQPASVPEYPYGQLISPGSTSTVWVAFNAPDAPPSNVKASIDGTTNILEGDGASKQALYTINLDHAATDPITITYATSDGSAIAGSRYQAASGSHTFAPGETSWSFPVNVLSDLVVEPDQTFNVSLTSALSLSSSTNASVDLAHSSIATTITDGTLPDTIVKALDNVKSGLKALGTFSQSLGALMTSSPIAVDTLKNVEKSASISANLVGVYSDVSGPLNQFNADIEKAAKTTDPIDRAQKEYNAYENLDVAIGNNSVKILFGTVAAAFAATPGVVGAEVVAYNLLLDLGLAGAAVGGAPVLAGVATGLVAGYVVGQIYDSIVAPAMKENFSKNFENIVPPPSNSQVPPQSSATEPNDNDAGAGDGGVQVASASLIHDLSSASGKIFALYEGFLKHAPDTAGGQSWVAALNAGASLHDVTNAILSSPEAQVHIASASDNATFVDQLYETVLGRHADPDSAHSWVAALDAGTTTRADVADALVFSDEHVAQLQPALSAGVPVTDPGVASAERLYEALLHRDADQTGLQNISDALAHGGTLQDVAQNILTSAEYTSAHPQMSDGQYVEALYENLLGRTGDAASAQSWTAALANGTDRASVANAFLDSAEFQNQYANQSSASYVEALYEHVLGHTGDAATVQSLASQLDAHSLTRIDVANSFTSSVEFQNHYPGSGDTGFIESLYQDALGRAPDAAGEQSWLYALSHGTSRADVALQIVDSPEAQQHLAAQVGAGLHVG